MPFLETFTGKENQRVSICEISTFWCEPGQPALALFQAATKGQNPKVRKIGTFSAYDSVDRMPVEIGGRWTVQSFDLNEGEIVKIWCRRKTNLSGVAEIGAVYIRMRENAALRKIIIPLLGLPSSNLRNGHYQGRFDILTMREASAAGVPLTPDDAQAASRAQFEKLFQVSIVEHERASVPVQAVQMVRMESGEHRQYVEERTTREIAL